MKRLTLAILLAGGALYASSPTTWEMNTYQDFTRGRFFGLSLSRDGRITIAPKLEPVFSSEQPSIWSVAQAPDTSFYVATGHRGRVFHIDAQGRGTLLWTAPQPEVFAVAVGPDGAVYAGSSPNGKVYRIQNGAAAEFFDPGARYIWSLQFTSDGSLYVGTGDQGKLFRVDRTGHGELWYDSGQAHITALAVDSEGRVLAGSEPNGILYRILGKEKAFVLYDANLPEIRSIVLGPGGAVYAAALGGSVAQRTSAISTTTSGTGAVAPVTAAPTTITVTDDTAGAQAGVEIKPKQDTTKQQQQPGAAAVAAAYAPVVDLTGVEKSAIYKINPDNTVETLWTSKEENAYDLLLNGDQVVFGTDLQGRIYRLGSDRRLTLIAQTGEGETTRLLNGGGFLVAATSTMGKLFRLTETPAAEGSYESPVHDAGGVARWGQIDWRGERTASTGLRFRTRSGNSARPDKTWSDWSEPVSDPKTGLVKSPNARFMQWRAEFSGSASAAPSLTSVSVSYLPQNTAPVIRSINVTTSATVTPAAAKSGSPATAASATYSITVTDTGETGASSFSGTPSQTVARGIGQQINVAWQAEDPDGDRLTYSLYFRGEEERNWKLLRGNFTESNMLFEGDVFADGKYYFRVVASDKLSNPGGAARESELISSPILFDSTPPTAAITSSRRIGVNRLEVDIEAVDATSGLRRAEYSLDAASWVPLEAADGVVDGRRERFSLRIENLTPGEHLLVIRVYDASNNAGLTKLLVQ